MHRGLILESFLPRLSQTSSPFPRWKLCVGRRSGLHAGKRKLLRDDIGKNNSRAWLHNDKEGKLNMRDADSLQTTAAAHLRIPVRGGYLNSQLHMSKVMQGKVCDL